MKDSNNPPDSDDRDDDDRDDDDRDDDDRDLYERIRDLAAETGADRDPASDGELTRTPRVAAHIDTIVSDLSPTARKHLAEAEREVAREHQRGDVDDLPPGELSPAEQRMLDVLTGGDGGRQ